MPLRDHFHSPLNDRRTWDELHGQWPAMLVIDLMKKLPAPYVASPNIHLGSQVEVDIAAFEDLVDAPEPDGGVAVYAPAKPAPDVEVETLDVDEYEVRVYDADRGRQLVAAIELVSPANKDRPGHRRQFVGKCATLLSQTVSVTIVDPVTSRSANLLNDLVESLGGPAAPAGATAIYAAACRPLKQGPRPRLQTWYEPLTVGQALPTLPLWLSEDLALPLDLEASYEETCRVLRLPN